MLDFLRLNFVCLLTGLLIAQSAKSDEIEFARDVLPILEKHCLDCHGTETAESKLQLDTQLNALRGGDSGEAAIVPGESDRSFLVTRILHDDPAQRMPPDSPPLAKDEISILRAWIDQAADWQDTIAELAGTRIEHWSFQPVQRPELVLSELSPIDQWIDAKLAEQGLARSPRAQKRQLIRRAHLVMHGLPPTPEQVDTFVQDSRDEAWDALVEELLTSPHYGERMATFWLDLVRFGETHGFETNRERPHAWRYRDWVIDAFNSDKPYDQFIIEQIAGDAVGADLGTGFLVAGPYDLVKGQDVQLQLMQRQDELADMINCTGTAFLGLTLGCARCHNHKFDPITQTDYYSLQAVFAGVNHADRALPQSDSVTQQLAEFDRQIAELKQDLSQFIAAPTNGSGAELRPAVNSKLNVEEFAPLEAKFVRFTINATNSGEPCIDELEIFSGSQNVALASEKAKVTSSGDFVHPLHKLEHIHDGQFGNSRSWISKDVSGGWVLLEFPAMTTIDRIIWARDREGQYRDRLATDYVIEISEDGQNWTRIASSADREPFTAGPPLEIQYTFDGVPEAEAERGRTQLSEMRKLEAARQSLATPSLAYAGTFSSPPPTHRLYRGEPSAPREQVSPAAIASLSDLKLPAEAPEQQRRLAIARWIADPENPLTARVIVNRLWQFHFGTGIVDTPSDFGSNGTRPTHPELLDWLASELVDSGWSLKHIHRLILLSETWQQDSRPSERGLKIDAGSRSLWRFPPRRLDAESIRDSILAVSGKLNLETGGPGFSAFEIEAENVRHYFPKQEFGPEDWRRMIYMTRVRQERDAVFGVFDCPDFSQVVPQRSRSTTPLQALNLLNSRFVLQQSEFLIERLEKEADSREERISLAYLLCFSRHPDQEELTSALSFVEESDWRQFARALLNANEFVFIP